MCRPALLAAFPATVTYFCLSDRLLLRLILLMKAVEAVETLGVGLARLGRSPLPAAIASAVRIIMWSVCFPFALDLIGAAKVLRMRSSSLVPIKTLSFITMLLGLSCTLVGESCCGHVNHRLSHVQIQSLAGRHILHSPHQMFLLSLETLSNLLGSIRLGRSRQ